MRIFRATVWTLSAVAACVDGYAAIQRRIREELAEDEQDFEAGIRDEYIHDVDNEVWFGPITDKGPEIGRAHV